MIENERLHYALQIVGRVYSRLVQLSTEHIGIDSSTIRSHRQEHHLIKFLIT